MTILLLALAAVLEVSGDFLMRVGLGGRRWGFLAGALVLAGYGLLVNQPAWEFGRTLGLYIAIFFIVSQLIAFINTAGYQQHSRATEFHRVPLPRTVAAFFDEAGWRFVDDGLVTVADVIGADS